MAFRVHVENPKKRKKRSKNMKKRRSRKKTTRRRRRNPTPRAPARRRRRAANPAPRRRRRRNPSGGGGRVDIAKEVKDFLPRLGGKLAAAWFAQRFGGGSVFGEPTSSITAGSSWSIPQYLAAIAAGVLIPRFFGRYVNATEFRRGAFDLVLTKLIWTEGIARSQWAQQAFGADGDVQYDPGSGQMMMQQGGRWVSMQGYGDALVQASPLDGLVEASPLDACPSGMGHLLPAGVSSGVADTGKWSGSGYQNNYAAAYSYR